jgi:hypothetical protein
LGCQLLMRLAAARVPALEPKHTYWRSQLSMESTFMQSLVHVKFTVTHFGTMVLETHFQCHRVSDTLISFMICVPLLTKRMLMTQLEKYVVWQRTVHQPFGAYNWLTKQRSYQIHQGRSPSLWTTFTHDTTLQKRLKWWLRWGDLHHRNVSAECD